MKKKTVRKGRGRKALPLTKRKSMVVSLRFSPTEMRDLKSIARRKAISVTELIRNFSLFRNFSL